MPKNIPPSNESSVDPQVEKDFKNYDQKMFESIQKQVDYEYKMSFDHQSSKKQEQLVRLKLYNNQRRDKDAVGDTTMFTVMQTVLASLYDDRLMAEFGGREEGDEETAENLNQMAQFDYDDMEKDVTDFFWDWDTLFFGRGLCNLTEYIRDPDNNIYLPVPEVWDPTTSLRDTRAVAINGDHRTGKNSTRFYGREINMSRSSMEDNSNFLANIKWEDLRFSVGMNSLMEQSSQARTDANGNTQLKNRSESRYGDNAEYTLLEWYTHWKVGGSLKKVQVWLANNRKIVVGFKVLGDPTSKWGLLDRPLYPTSHDWDGTSIPDLTEDKQRHRAVAANLGLKAMTSDMYPNYIYDQNKIKNRADLNFGFNKFIPVDGDPTAILPMRKASPNMMLLEFIYNTLDISAQKATATPDIQQGIQSQKDRPLGETNIIASRTDTRYSLSAKVFGWSEKRFWQQWYKLYKDNFESDIDKKVLRIVGAFGAKWRELDRSNIIANIDPDVKIESKNLSRAKQLEDRQSLTVYFANALSDPTANRRWAMKKLGKLNGLMKDEIDRLYPPTIDEMQAEDENNLLNDGKFVKVLAEQDHNVHLEIHSKAKYSPATKAHIETHKHALMQKRLKPEAFPTTEDQTGSSFAPGGAPLPGLGGTRQPMGVRPTQTSGMAG